jgi:hypothetical protein
MQNIKELFEVNQINFDDDKEMIKLLIWMLDDLDESIYKLERRIENLLGYAIAMTIIAIIGWMV